MLVNEATLVLEERLLTSTATVAVVGMGCVGLALALNLVERGFHVHTIRAVMKTN